MGKYTKITRLTLFTFHGTRHRWLNSLATIFRRSARVKMWKESKRLSFLENDARTIRAMINCVLLFPHAPARWTTPRASTTTASNQRFSNHQWHQQFFIIPRLSNPLALGKALRRANEISDAASLWAENRKGVETEGLKSTFKFGVVNHEQQKNLRLYSMFLLLCKKEYVWNAFAYVIKSENLLSLCGGSFPP